MEFNFRPVSTFSTPVVDGSRRLLCLQENSGTISVIISM